MRSPTEVRNLAYGREYWGNDPTQKESGKPVRLALYARKTLGALYEIVRTVMCREKNNRRML